LDENKTVIIVVDNYSHPSDATNIADDGRNGPTPNDNDTDWTKGCFFRDGNGRPGCKLYAAIV